MTTTSNKISRVLGIAFLLQFITSFSSSVFIKPLWLVPGNISETMLKIAGNPDLLRTNILVDMFTTLGVIFLGAERIKRTLPTPAINPPINTFVGRQ